MNGEFEKPERELSEAARRLAVSLTWVCAAFLAAGVGLRVFGAGFESPGRFAAGLAVGWACSVAKVCMMAGSFFGMTRPGEGSAGARFMRSFMISLSARYAVTIAAAVPVLLFAQTFGPAGFLGGLLSMPIGGYLGSRG
jgi:hypothetical protein